MEITTPLQQLILKNFSQVIDSSQFYLTGGTALAYFYLKHRRSNDLDFFTSLPEIVDPFSRNLENLLKNQGMNIERQRGTRSFVELYVKGRDETTIVQLAQDAAFRFESTLEFPAYPHLRVDSLRDIASNKLLALFGRAAVRDFIDIYMLVKQGGFIQEALIQDAMRKDPGFDLYWLAVAFERIRTFPSDSPEMLMLLKPLSFEALVRFFDQWRQAINEKLRP